MPFFLDDDDRQFFVGLLEGTARRLQWRIHAYCLMSTHYHAVLETPPETISVGMQRLNSIYVKAFNARWGRFGTLVAARFGSRMIESEKYLSQACGYVFLNPVKANLCDRASDWRWSGGLFSSSMSDL